MRESGFVVWDGRSLAWSPSPAVQQKWSLVGEPAVTAAGLLGTIRRDMGEAPGRVFLLPGAVARLGLPRELMPERSNHQFMIGADRQYLAPSFQVENSEVLIGSYLIATGDPWGALTATEFADELSLFEQALKWTYRASPQATGWTLMHGLWKAGQRSKRLKPLEILPGEEQSLGAGQVEVPFGAWIDPHCRAHTWWHAYDINGQRLAACSRLALPFGALREGRLQDQFDDRPGYSLLEEDVFIPGLGMVVMTAGWHTNIRVQLARQAGLRVAVSRSRVYEAGLDYLTPWYDRLRRAREALTPYKHPVAREVLKQCYLQPLGRLRSNAAMKRKSRWYRPAWYDHVIGCELGRQTLHLAKIAGAAEIKAVYFDTVVIASEIEDPVIAAAEARVQLSSRLGQFKHIGSAQAWDVHKQLQSSPQVGALIRMMEANQ